MISISSYHQVDASEADVIIARTRTRTLSDVLEYLSGLWRGLLDFDICGEKTVILALEREHSMRKEITYITWYLEGTLIDDQLLFCLFSLFIIVLLVAHVRLCSNQKDVPTPTWHEVSMDSPWLVGYLSLNFPYNYYHHWTYWTVIHDFRSKGHTNQGHRWSENRLIRAQKTVSSPWFWIVSCSDPKA